MSTSRQILRRDGRPDFHGSGERAPELRWLWFGLFLLGLVLLGGSSRPDPMQNAILRPLAGLMLLPAIYHLRLADLRRAKAIVAIIGLLLVWMIIQLVPLPPNIWGSLPDRSLITQIDQIGGIEGTWRSISLTPFRGLNSALSMVVPIAALLLALSMKIPSRTLLSVIVGIGLIDAAFGMLQVISGTTSSLYLFAITNRGSPVGIFANENHSAVFSAIVLLTIARLAAASKSAGDPRWMRLAAAPAFAFILLAALLTGSRAGLAATILALMASGAILWLSRTQTPATASGHINHSGIGSGSSIKLTALSASAIFSLILTFIWFERTPAFEDILNRNSFEDLRWSLWPILTTMAGQHWLFGTGFGSFDAVYHIYEPTELLLPRYVNHAHNDWAQIVIEGGLPAIILLSAFLGWLAQNVWGLSRYPGARWSHTIYWTAIIAIIAAASVVDYPLRTPIFQVSAIWLMLRLISDINSKKSLR